MMRMTVRQVRAYLAESVKIRAREAIEGSVVAGIHAMDAHSASSILAVWRQIAGEEPEKRVVDGQLVEMRGQWKVIPRDKVRDFFRQKRQGA